ncbi:hypothetical protein Rs2_33291 [Raphanus sativus]|nr:hypothetical protein Rs2_33291 [Raphanus sativus]
MGESAGSSSSWAAISSSNIGFQLLKKQGWKEGTGLGAAEQGILVPVQTEPKNNKRGLGAAAEKPKPAKRKAVKPSTDSGKEEAVSKQSKKLSKKMRKLMEHEKLLQEKEFERAFFREFWPDNLRRIRASPMASLLQPSSRLLLQSQTQHNVRQQSLLPRSSPKTPFLVSLPSLRPSKPNLLSTSASASKKPSEIESKKQKSSSEVEEEEEEVEEDMLWIQEKALDLVEFTGSVTQAIPGPRVGSSKLPWMLAVPLAYAGVTFVTAFVKTVKKFSSPKAQRKKLVNQNAMLCRSIDELLQKEGGTVNSSELKAIEEKTGFNMVEILRKYIRYALNEKPFNPDLVASLIHLRRASGLDDSQIPEILNEISRRIVKEKGPVVMNMQGFTEKGFKRKLAVQALFGKIYYLSELPDFCSKDNSLMVKEIFGVTDEDAEKLRIHALAEAGDIDSLEKMVEFEKAADSSSDIEDTNEEDDTTTTTTP